MVDSSNGSFSNMSQIPNINITEDKTDFSVVKHINGVQQTGYENLNSGKPSENQNKNPPKTKIRGIRAQPIKFTRKKSLEKKLQSLKASKKAPQTRNLRIKNPKMPKNHIHPSSPPANPSQNPVKRRNKSAIPKPRVMSPLASKTALDHTKARKEQNTQLAIYTVFRK